MSHMHESVSHVTHECGMSQIGESWNTHIYHVTHEGVMSYMHESLSHVTHECGMSQIDESWNTHIYHVIHEGVMSHMNASCHTRTGHVTHGCHEQEYTLKKSGGEVGGWGRVPFSRI